MTLNEGGKSHSDLPVDSVGSRKGKEKNRKVQNSPPQGRVTHDAKCTRCGREPHARNSCPAKEAICHTCKKRGHYSSQCFKKLSVADININAPMNSLKSTMTHCSWTPLILDRRICGMS